MDNITKPTISELFSTSWKIFLKNIWLLIGFYAGYLIISFIFNLISSATAVTIIIPLLINLIMLAVGIIFNMGFAQTCLNAVDEKELSFDSFTQHIQKLWFAFVGSIFMGVIVGIGMILLIIPGLWLATRLQFYIYFIIEENRGPIKAIQQSWEMTKGQDSFLLLWLLAAIVIVIVGFICLGIGAIVSVILISISSACLFRYFRSPKLQEQAEEAINEQF